MTSTTITTLVINNHHLFELDDLDDTETNICNKNTQSVAFFLFNLGR